MNRIEIKRSLTPLEVSAARYLDLIVTEEVRRQCGAILHSLSTGSLAAVSLTIVLGPSGVTLAMTGLTDAEVLQGPIGTASEDASS